MRELKHHQQFDIIFLQRFLHVLFFCPWPQIQKFKKSCLTFKVCKIKVIYLLQVIRLLPRKCLKITLRLRILRKK